MVMEHYIDVVDKCNLLYYSKYQAYEYLVHKLAVIFEVYKLLMRRFP